MPENNMSPEMPDDLKRAYETFTMMCSHYGIFYAALAFRIDPYGMYIIGNLTNSGVELAELLREQARMIDEKEKLGLVQAEAPSKERVN